jgi:hypothetical protein
MKPQINNLGVIAVRPREGLANLEGSWQVDRGSKDQGVLLWKRRQPFQHSIRDERRHLPYLRKIIRVLYAVDDEI